jgi:hypothetical protein
MWLVSCGTNQIQKTAGYARSPYWVTEMPDLPILEAFHPTGVHLGRGFWALVATTLDAKLKEERCQKRKPWTQILLWQP